MPTEYLLLMAACLAITLPLEFVLRARVYRRWRRLLLALLPVVVLFYLWDVWAISRGHWHFSPVHTTGVLLPGAVPLEELVFFLVIPVCGLLTYEAVGTVLGRSSSASPPLEREIPDQVRDDDPSPGPPVPSPGHPVPSPRHPGERRDLRADSRHGVRAEVRGDDQPSRHPGEGRDLRADSRHEIHADVRDDGGSPQAGPNA